MKAILIMHRDELKKKKKKEQIVTHPGGWRHGRVGGYQGSMEGVMAGVEGRRRRASGEGHLCKGLNQNHRVWAAACECLLLEHQVQGWEAG